MDWLSTKNGMNLIASHEIELTNISHSIYDNYHFREIVKEDGIYFDSKIHPGPSSTKNAIKLLEVMNFPLLVTERAHNLANDFIVYGKYYLKFKKVKKTQIICSLHFLPLWSYSSLDNRIISLH